MPIRHLTTLLFSTALLVGCSDDSTNGDSGGGEGTSGGDPDACDDCDSDLWQCYCYQDRGLFAPDWQWWPYNKYCSSEATAATNCAAYCTAIESPDTIDYKIEEIPCSDNSSGGSCSSWDPAEDITYDAGTYYVDAVLIGGLLSDPYELWTCDDAYFDGLSGDGFELTDADSGELLYELGLRDGDIPQALNGQSLDTYDDAAAALAEYLNGETDFTLEILRGTNTVYLYYSVVVS